jgi:general secretion pathway protein K
VNNRKGFALVVTLLVTALLVALVVEFITEVYVDTSGRQSFVDGQRASLLAGSGVEGAQQLLQLTLATQADFTSLRDQWAQPIEFPDESGTLRVVIEEENGKLNLNYVDGATGIPSYAEAVNRLFGVLKLPARDLLDALSDWLDSDDVPKPGGGESAYYLARKPAYRPSNGPLLTLDELAMVKGFDAAAMQQVRPFVTVHADYTDAAYVNINTAPKAVLMALADGMTDSLAQSIIDYRTVTPFKGAGELSRVAGMDTVMPTMKVLLRTRGSIYRIRSEATVDGTTRVIEAVVNLAVLSSPRMLYWREY